MNKYYYLILALLLTSCFSKKNIDPIILPPNFAEMPDLSNPEKPTAQQKKQSIVKLKELLLESEEN